jgi:MFS family permease
MPVFFLYLSSVLPPAQVLQLEAIYYFAVVLLEVPSGYFSDRFGRRTTLLIATVCWMAASLTFALGSGFVTFAIAQVLLAAGMAFNSGTDSALLYESLSALDRSSELAEQEARAQTAGFYAMAGAAVAGGLVAGVDLTLAYWLSAAAGIGGIVTAWRFIEPPPPANGQRAQSPMRQLAACAGHLREPALRWVFLFAVVMIIFNHVPYEFAQPWLDMLLAVDAASYNATPAAAGVMVALVALVAAWVGRRAARVRARFGTPATLLAAMALQGVVMLGMALFLHPLVLVLILARSVPRALATPTIRAEIHPRIETGIRATFFSLQSLAGRLSFSATLTVASLTIGDHASLTFAAMSNVIVAYAIGLGALLALFSIGARRKTWVA